MINLAQRALNFVFARLRKGSSYFELNSGFACHVCVLYKLHESDDSVMGVHEMISPDDEFLTIRMYDSLSYFSFSYDKLYASYIFDGEEKILLSILFIYLFIYSFLNSIDETFARNFSQINSIGRY